MSVLRAVGAWLMERGISADQPGWLFVPFVSWLAYPLTIVILIAAGVSELSSRIDRALHPRRAK